MTIAQALKGVTAKLEEVSDAPRLDAERILLHVLKRPDSSWLITHGNSDLSLDQLDQVQRLTEERMMGMPLAYVLGEWDFYGRTFAVDTRVLVPRPATEALVERALAWLLTQDKACTVADIGTGSGIVAITLVLEMRKRDRLITMLASDISPEALEVVRENARRHHVTSDIEFLQGDMLEPFAERQVDLIVSNPPYVPTAEILTAGRDLQTRGLLFEPRAALDGGPDGQTFIKKITASGIPAVIEGLNGEILDLTAR